MKIVYKYSLLNLATLMLPKDFQLLTIEVVNDDIVLYALVNEDEKEMEELKILCYYTGESIVNHFGATYLKTIRFNGLVYHYFRV